MSLTLQQQQPKIQKVGTVTGNVELREFKFVKKEEKNERIIEFEKLDEIPEIPRVSFWGRAGRVVSLCTGIAAGVLIISGLGLGGAYTLMVELANTASSSFRGYFGIGALAAEFVAGLLLTAYFFINCFVLRQLDVGRDRLNEIRDMRENANKVQKAAIKYADSSKKLENEVKKVSGDLKLQKDLTEKQKKQLEVEKGLIVEIKNTNKLLVANLKDEKELVKTREREKLDLKNQSNKTNEDLKSKVLNLEVEIKKIKKFQVNQKNIYDKGEKTIKELQKVINQKKKKDENFQKNINELKNSVNSKNKRDSLSEAISQLKEKQEDQTIIFSLVKSALKSLDKRKKDIKEQGVFIEKLKNENKEIDKQNKKILLTLESVSNSVKEKNNLKNAVKTLKSEKKKLGELLDKSNEQRKKN